LEQALVGASRDVAVTAVGQSEEKVVEPAVVERTVLVKPDKAATQKVSDQTIGAESFASLSKGSPKTSPQQLKDGFVGLWAADARACEPRAGAGGSDLRTVIGRRGARAGSNSCSFKEKKQIGSTEWEMKALCADGSSRWESNVRLSLSKNKLKWSGQRGTQIYYKCAQGGVAQAELQSANEANSIAPIIRR
jgi:hypothetical protein